MKTKKLFATSILGLGLALSIAPAFAETLYNDAVHDERGRTVRDSNGHCVRTKWLSGKDECSGYKKTQGYERHEIADEERTIYFEFDKTRLVGTAEAKLDSLANTLKSMEHITGVSIVGYADRIGSDKYNDDLSKRRAKVVENALRKRGYLNTTIAETRWLGESVPVTNCEGGLSRAALITCLQKDRRVTVEINYEDDELYPTNKR